MFSDQQASLRAGVVPFGCFGLAGSFQGLQASPESSTRGDGLAPDSVCLKTLCGLTPPLFGMFHGLEPCVCVRVRLYV